MQQMRSRLGIMQKKLCDLSWHHTKSAEVLDGSVGQMQFDYEEVVMTGKLWCRL